MFRIFSGTTWNASGVTPSGIVVKTKRELPVACFYCGGKVNKVKLPNFYKE